MSQFSSNVMRIPSSLLAACRTHGLAQRTDEPLSAPLVLFEAGEGTAASLTEQSSSGLIEHLRTGGHMVFSMQPYAGLSAFRLSSVLPSTGWTTTLRPSPFTPQEPISIIAADHEFFRDFPIDGLTVPPAFDIRPTSAVERGQARYERYDLQHPVLKTSVPAGTDLWSRPLLNREWTVRANYSDVAQLPLLVTGRYGGGRVAMLATSVAAIGETAQARAFWSSIVGWLLASDDIPASVPALFKPDLSITFPKPGSVSVTVTNASAEPMTGNLVLRMLDQNGALLADGVGEFQRLLTVPPKMPSVTTLTLPFYSLDRQQSGGASQVLQIRASILSADCSDLLAEERTTSPPPPVRLTLQTDNLYAIPYASHAPGPDALAGFQSRMGVFTSAYAYKPGAVVNIAALLSFHSANLGPLAQVRDVTQPGNASVMALNDLATGLRQVPSPEHIEAYGNWSGKSGIENVIEFALPAPARLAAVTLVGSFGTYANAELHNPGSLFVELDGLSIGAIDDLDAAFAAGYGQARLVPPNGTFGTVLTIRMPWVAQHRPTGRPRQEPWLGEVLIEGWPADGEHLSDTSGELVVDLVDALNGERQRILKVPVQLGPGETIRRPLSMILPSFNSGRASVLRVEATYQTSTDSETIHASVPILLVEPGMPLKPFTDLSPPGQFGTAMVVTNGFTRFVREGTGTSEAQGGWGKPDDLIWAYSRQMKEVPPRAHTAANRLYATETDMRHYSTPWREFPNGELFFPTAISGLVSYLKEMPKWSSSTRVQLTFADRWTIGPNLAYCNSWQEYVAFDSHLRKTTGKTLAGSTHLELETSIHTDYENEWQAWQLDRYVLSVRAIRDAFREEGKEAFIYAQEFPLVAGALGRELAKTIRGMNDDFTWGMQDNSPTLTIGRHLGEISFNPVWEVTAMLPWGFVSPVFNNWQWHTPVSTAEPSRRLLYNRTWRATVWDDGRYGGIHKYGYTVNVGTPYTLTEEDFQQWWYVQERGSLLQPEAPFGAGLLISTQRNADPRSTRFNNGDATTMIESRMLMEAFRALHDAGVSLPFATNASTLGGWPLSPNVSLIVLNLQDFSESEVTNLSRLVRKGTLVAAFAHRSSLSPSASALADHANVVLIERSPTGMSHAHALEIARQLLPALQLPLRFSTGTAGYGFYSQGTLFVVVEDWLEQARDAVIHVRKSKGAHHAMAANLNDHSTLAVSDAGEFWKIYLPLRSGDGVLMAVKEVLR